MNGSKIQILSSLEKVFSDSKNNYKEYGGFSMLKNEKKSFQVVFCASKGKKSGLTWILRWSNILHTVT